MRKSHHLRSRGCLKSFHLRQRSPPLPFQWRKNPEKSGKARAGLRAGASPTACPRLVIIARLGRVRARAHHVPVKLLGSLVRPPARPRAAPSLGLGRQLQPCSTLDPTLFPQHSQPPPHPPQPLAGLRTRPAVAPSIWLLNCHRLGSTQAPPFEPGHHAPEKRPRPSPPPTSSFSRIPTLCGVSPLHWLNFSLDPAPEVGPLPSLAGSRLGLRP